MILLDMMIGTMDILIGFVVFLIVVLIEAIFLSKQLAGKWIKAKIFNTVLLSNFISTIAGIFGLLSWLWDYIESAIKKFLGFPEDFTSTYFTILFVLFALISTLILEIPVNLLFLHRDFKRRNIIINSIYANILTYTLLGILALITN